jgi:hypothetical protein
MSDAGVSLPFSNDGSFMEQFLKMQQQQQQEQPQKEPQAAEDAKPRSASPEGAAAAADADATATAATATAEPRSVSEQPQEEQPQGEQPQEQEQEQQEQEQARFEASATFTGARAGYVFTTGEEGTGYYLDTLEEWMAQAAKPKPVVLKRNNPIIKIQPKMAAADSRKRKLGERLPGCLRACKQAAAAAAAGRSSRPQRAGLRPSSTRAGAPGCPSCLPANAARRVAPLITCHAEDDSKPRYLRELDRYKQMSCGSDTKHERPLVK